VKGSLSAKSRFSSLHFKSRKRLTKMPPWALFAAACVSLAAAQDVPECASRTDWGSSCYMVSARVLSRLQGSPARLLVVSSEWPCAASTPLAAVMQSPAAAPRTGVQGGGDQLGALLLHRRRAVHAHGRRCEASRAPAATGTEMRTGSASISGLHGATESHTGRRAGIVCASGANACCAVSA